ncbi:MAG: family 20 glycosylhydrolase [Calditrichae bacterium]|nr:family 20 glycosylhydrolase [Calditrichia bacterium]
MVIMLVNLTIVAENEAPSTRPPLLPVPAQVEYSDGQFRLNAEFTLAVEGKPHERMFRGATRFLRRLSGRTGLFFLQHYITETGKSRFANLVINCRRPGVVKLGTDESYRLTVTPEKIELQADNDIGALRGLETLLQLLQADEKGYFLPAVKIVDAPRFPWRGLLIDVSRHFMPMEVLKRNLDGMAAVKLNVLHWHLVDDQGFRVESKTFPKLHEMGSDGFYFTQEQIREIIAYANDRGIRVMPEFDVPAHATSWLVGYPELGSAPGPYTVERNWGIMDPVLDPTRDAIYDFLDQFFAEMAGLFPDEYLHIGGDENNGKHWNANQDIQAFMKKNNIPDNHALQSYFNQRILKIVTKHGKKMIGWDEIFHPDLPKTAVIHSWRGKEAMVKAAQQGYMSILSNGYYIDLMQPAYFHYLNDPIPEDTPLSEKEQRAILGGEATSWGELVSPETIDSRIWPRTAAIAERLWSPQRVKDVEDMYRRLEVISFQLEEHGLTHRKNFEMMLRRLTGDRDITPLRTFIELVEPVKIYTRHHQGVKYTSSSPLTRVVDAARPESMAARDFARRVDSLLANPSENNQAAVADLLKIWKRNHAALQAIINTSPVLREIESLSQDLTTISEIGMAAGNYYSSRVKPSEAWHERSLELLEAARKPRGQVMLMVVDPIEKLVKAVKTE